MQVAEISSQARYALEQARKELQAAERQAEEARSQVGRQDLPLQAMLQQCGLHRHAGGSESYASSVQLDSSSIKPANPWHQMESVMPLVGAGAALEHARHRHAATTGDVPIFCTVVNTCPAG